MPFIIGGALGVPIGAVLLAYINPSYMRIIVGLTGFNERAADS
jgi:uncharacterized membrane protein YfcA